MLGRRSPLLIRPTLRPGFMRWLYEFARSTSPSRYSAGMAALVGLGSRALGAFDRLRDAGVQFEMHSDGMLFVARDDKELEGEARSLEEQRALGLPGGFEVLDRAGAHAFEPALAPGVAGAIYLPDERHVRPESLSAGLIEHLHARGVAIREHTAVAAVELDGAGWRVRIGAETLRSDRVVLALGTATRDLLSPLGVRLPLEGAKGYSFTDQRPAVRPRRPLYLLEAKVAVSPFREGLRLAGTLELGSRDLSVDIRRLAALDGAGSRYLRDWRPDRRRGWAGMRSLLPDGLPAIGSVPGHEGLFAATGHGMLGITLAPATAEVLAQAVCDDRAHPDLVPFSPARFGNRALSRRPAETPSIKNDLRVDRERTPA